MPGFMCRFYVRWKAWAFEGDMVRYNEDTSATYTECIQTEPPVPIHKDIMQPHIYSYVFKFKAVTSKSAWWSPSLCVSPPN